MARRTRQEPSKRETSTERIAMELRERALAAKEGELLGSEEEFCALFGISRPTLRQATSLLRQEEILEVRRGINGGYYARRPTFDGIARLAGTYLRTNSASLDDIDDALDALTPFIITSVIKSGKSYRFAEFTVDATGVSEEQLIASQLRFYALLNELTDNFVIQIIQAIIYKFGETVPRVGAQADVAGRLKFLKMRVALAKALVAGDAEKAIPLFTQFRHSMSNGIRSILNRPQQRRRRAPQ